MASERSRAYRVRFSSKGTRLFLDCHCRLARLNDAFIPYGSTLFVALLVAEGRETADVAARIEQRTTDALVGSIEHFVGGPRVFTDVVAELNRRLDECEHGPGRPRLNKLYAACLTMMAECEDADLRLAYDRVAEIISGRQAEATRSLPFRPA